MDAVPSHGFVAAAAVVIVVAVVGPIDPWSS